MNSINWPASSVWVFIAQLGEHCSANAEATGSNPVEAPKIFFSGYFRNCLNCDSLRWSHTHFIRYCLYSLFLFSVFVILFCSFPFSFFLILSVPVKLLRSGFVSASGMAVFANTPFVMYKNHENLPVTEKRFLQRFSCPDRPKIQRRAARFIKGCFAREGGTVSNLLNELDREWSSLQERRRISRLTIMYKIVNGLSPIPVPNYVYQKTRVTCSFHWPKRFINLSSSSNTYTCSFFARAVKEWNTLLDHLIEQQNVNSLKSALAAYLNQSPV